MSIDMYIGSGLGITQHAPRHFRVRLCIKTLYHDSLKSLSATHISAIFDDQILACTIAEIHVSVALTLLMQAVLNVIHICKKCRK